MGVRASALGLRVPGFLIVMVRVVVKLMVAIVRVRFGGFPTTGDPQYRPQKAKCYSPYYEDPNEVTLMLGNPRP